MSPLRIHATRARTRAAAFVLAASAALVAFIAPFLPGYASEVVSTVPGFAATSTPDNVVGAPSGGGIDMGSTDTYSLGVGGSITVRLDPPVVNGAGTDLIVCENPFLVLGTPFSFVEAMYVEVSTNGVDFARFPSRYVGPQGLIPDFTGVSPALYSGLAGVMPAAAHPPEVDPLDVVAAGGDAFDLDALADDPLVTSGVLNLWFVEYVRLVDVETGATTDSQGTLIWDCGNEISSSADLDAIVGVNTLDNQIGGRPEVHVGLVNDVLVIRLADTDGLGDIKSGLTLSVNGFDVPFGWLLPYFVVTDFGPSHVELSSLGTIPPGMFQAVVKVAARDPSGLVGGDAAVVQ
ncbi:MAG: hypothetical protein ACYTG2_11565 [Planctomycetota bacterium]|jgi:hypothetical protein